MVLTESIRRDSLGHKSHQSMDFSPLDGPQICGPLEDNYENKIEIPEDTWWDSIFGIDDFKATGDQVLPNPPTAALGSTPSSSSGSGQSPSLHLFNNHLLAGDQLSGQVAQSPTDYLGTFNARSAPHPDELSKTVPSSRLDITAPYDPLAVMGIKSAGHGSGPHSVTPPNRSYDLRSGLEQQPQTPSLVAETNIYSACHGALLLGPDGSSVHSQRTPEPNTGDALAVNRAGCLTSENSAKPYFYSAGDHRRAIEQNAIHVDVYEDTLVEHPSSKSPIWSLQHHFGARSASDPNSPGIPLPMDLSQASLYIPSTSLTRTSSIDDSWKCDNCGRVLATKGTKNRDRNKRRHRCPGTGPKCPCPICPKSFNRGDTRLLHLRKWHPGAHVEPPRARKRKNRS